MITIISFSSCEQPIRILNFYNKFFVSLFFKYILPGKSFELRLNYIEECQYKCWCSDFLPGKNTQKVNKEKFVFRKLVVRMRRTKLSKLSFWVKMVVILSAVQLEISHVLNGTIANSSSTTEVTLVPRLMKRKMMSQEIKFLERLAFTN